MLKFADQDFKEARKGFQLRAGATCTRHALTHGLADFPIKK